MEEINGTAQEPTNIGITLTMGTCMMMGTSRINITMTNPGILTITHTMITTPGSLINARWTREARERACIGQLTRSQRRLKSKLSLESKL